VFADLAPIAPQVSIEAVIAADPQAIITAEARGNRAKHSASGTAVRRSQQRAMASLHPEPDRMNRHGRASRGNRGALRGN